jgi:hypothetical protein
MHPLLSNLIAGTIPILIGWCLGAALTGRRARVVTVWAAFVLTSLLWAALIFPEPTVYRDEWLHRLQGVVTLPVGILAGAGVLYLRQRRVARTAASPGFDVVQRDAAI